MAYELISVYRSPEDQTYVPIFARKLKDRDQERCIYMSDLEIEFPRAVGLRVEVQVGENMKWVPLRSVRQQDRDVVIFNADQLGCRFLANQHQLISPERKRTLDKHPSTEQLAKMIKLDASESNNLDSISTNSLVFSKDPIEITANFTHYESIGRFCRSENSSELVEFNNLLDRISTFSSPPFTFVCSSSGAGKTQLPFCLDRPLLYFVYNKYDENLINVQDIYVQFKEPSEYLRKAFENDRLAYIALFNQIKNGKSRESSAIENPKLLPSFNMGEFSIAINMRFESVGFLVEFIKRVYTATREHNTSWMRAQLREFRSIKSDCPPPMTIEDANEVLNVFQTNNREFKRPIIFLDEVVNMINQFDQSLFYMVRSLLRLLKIGSVFMGTNAKVSTIQTINNLFYKGSRQEENAVWSFIVHKLPPMNQSYLTEKKAEIDELIVKNQPIKDFVDFLFSLLKRERPFFVCQTIKFLRDLIKKQIKDPLAAFESIVKEVYESFIYSKNSKDSVSFFYGQLEFLMPRVYCRDLASSCIHKHTGYVSVPWDVNSASKISIQAHLKPSGLTYLSKKPYAFPSLTVRSSLPRFDTEPLTGLCFSGPPSSVNDVFPSDKNLTLISAYLEVKRDPNYSSVQSLGKDDSLDGDALERLTAAALILASHDGAGFSGHPNFQAFFPKFVKQFQSSSNKPLTIDFETNGDLWQKFGQTRIPYSSTVSSQQISLEGGIWAENIELVNCSILNTTRISNADANRRDLYRGDFRGESIDGNNSFSGIFEGSIDNVKVSGFVSNIVTDAKINCDILVNAKKAPTKPAMIWDPAVYNYLISQGCCLGQVVETAVREAAVDVELYSINPRDGTFQQEIAVKNRMHQDGRGAPDINITIAKFLQMPDCGRIFIILVRQLQNYRAINKTLLNNNKVWLVKLVRIEDGKFQYSFRNEHEPPDVEKVCILMDLATTFPDDKGEINRLIIQ